MFSHIKELFTRPSGYNISRSVRLRSSASAYFNRTFSTPTNSKTWTWNGWVKIGSGGFVNNQTLFGAGSYSYIYLNDGTNPTLRLNSSGTSSFDIATSQYFRDPAAWYMITVAFDSTQATASNRVKMYVNGIQVTSFAYATYPALNDSTYINTAIAHSIGARVVTSSLYFDGYLAEVNFIDGQALTPNSFGTFNSYGVWQPITYGGSYGTNGFYLPFTNTTSATTLAYDFSPNGNNWTPNNISTTAGVTYDSMTDVPTLTSATAANYAVSNVLDIDRANITTSNGNLTLTKATANDSPRAASTFGATSGKFYAEITWTSITDTSPNANYIITGVTTKEQWVDTSNGYNAVLYAASNSAGGLNGQRLIWTAGSTGSGWAAYGSGYWVAGSVIGIALNLDAGTVTFYNNGVSQGAITLPTTTQPWFFYNSSDGTGNGYTANWNFGQRPFSYTAPSGFVALNTYNL
jgi:hypothetical protein